MLESKLQARNFGTYCFHCYIFNLNTLFALMEYVFKKLVKYDKTHVNTFNISNILYQSL